MRAKDVMHEIEAFYRRFAASGPLFARARAGQVTAPLLHEYLANVEYLTKSTIPCLRAGVRRARQLGRADLADYFAAKIGEETGHHEWAREDQKALVDAFALPPAGNGVDPCIKGLVKAQSEAIARDPVLYLAYMLFTEYFTVLAVPEWVALLESRCALPPRYMSVLTKHAELDKDHVAVCAEEVDALTAGYGDEAGFFAHLALCFDWYERFCAELGRRHETPDRKSA